MISFKNIVLPTDLSANADAAKPYAIELAKKFDATIHLVHVFENDLYYAAGAPTDVAGFNTEWLVDVRAKQEDALKRKAALIAAEKVGVVHLMRQGNAAREIVNYARAVEAGCIVIATHGRTGLSHLIMGSVAERVLRLSPCPVLSVCPQNLRLNLV